MWVIGLTARCCFARAEYNKWTNLDTSSFPTSSFAGLNYTTRNAGLSIDPSLTILADTSNTGSGSWAGSTLINDASTSLTLPNGRYIRVRTSLL